MGGCTVGNTWWHCRRPSWKKGCLGPNGTEQDAADREREIRDARRGGKVSLPQFVDLSIDNTYGITFQDFGVKEEFSCGSNLPSCLARPRWFISGPKLFDLDVQLAIVDELTGVSNNISSDAVKARRSKHFMAFVRRESNDYGYSRDIPTIVYHYHRHLDGYITTIDPKHISEKNGVSARAFDSTELDKVKDLLRV